MINIQDAMNGDDLAQRIELLSGEIGRMRQEGPLNLQDVQTAIDLLTQAQLVLNELESIAARKHGANLDKAERFAHLNTQLRLIRYDLYRSLKYQDPDLKKDTKTP